MFEYLSKTFFRFFRTKQSDLSEQFDRNTPITEDELSQNVVSTEKQTDIVSTEKQPELGYTEKQISIDTISEKDESIPEIDVILSEIEMIIAEKDESIIEQLQINTDLYDNDYNEKEETSIDNSPMSSIDSFPFHPNKNENEDNNSDPYSFQNEPSTTDLPVLNNICLSDPHSIEY